MLSSPFKAKLRQYFENIVFFINILSNKILLTGEIIQLARSYLRPIFKPERNESGNVGDVEGGTESYVCLCWLEREWRGH